MTTPEQQHEPLPPPTSGGLARELFGDLPCIGCRYNLRGLSIRHFCPECGMPVRATILAHVDPHAAELQPVILPRVTAYGMVVWSSGALVAVLLVWLIRLAGLSDAYFGSRVETGPIIVLSAIALLVSGVGAATLIRPQRHIPVADTVRAAIGVVLYIPLIAVHWWMLADFDSGTVEPYFGQGGPSESRSLVRIAIAILVAIIIFGLRGNARRLATRSLLIRTGRVDRQTMLAVQIAVLGGAVGDGLHLLAAIVPTDLGELVRLVGTFVIVSASMFVTIGLASIVIDTLRLWPAVARRVLSLDDLTRVVP
jgi:hypothetical protein